MEGGPWLDGGGVAGGGLAGWRHVAGWSGPGWMEGAWMESGWRGPDWMDGGVGRSLVRVDGRCLKGGGGRMEGWMEWFCGSVRAVRVACRFSGLRFFAVHRAARFLAVRFRFAVRFAAFLKPGSLVPHAKHKNLKP